MPIVKIDIVPGLLQGDKESQYKRMVKAVTGSIVESLNVPKEAVHVIIREHSLDRYSLAGEFFSDQKKD